MPPLIYRKRLIFIITGLVLGFTQQANCSDNNMKKTVVLLHGLARSSASMNKLQKALDNKGCKTLNIEYPSTKDPIEVLARDYITPRIKAHIKETDFPVNFVTHSMGGIIVRYLARHQLIPEIGRVVMLSPPNKGSEVVDTLGRLWLFGFINGPAGRQLDTDRNSMPMQLGPADFELGVITGNRSINLLLSLLIKGDDDGKVSIERAKLEGMKDFIVLPAAHPFIMKDKKAIAQTIHFLEHGVFDPLQ